MPRLACPAAEQAECTGATTTVALEAPSAFSSCSGGALGAITSDAPSAGYPLGTTTVSFSATDGSGARASCTAEVRVSDTTPPSVSCPASLRVIRLSPSDPITSAEVTATDGCDPSPTLALEPPMPGHGTTRVTATATDDAGLSASCSFEATILDLFAPTELRVVSATRTGAGATDVTLVRSGVTFEPLTGSQTIVATEPSQVAARGVMVSGPPLAGMQPRSTSAGHSIAG